MGQGIGPKLELGLVCGPVCGQTADAPKQCTLLADGLSGWARHLSYGQRHGSWERGCMRKGVSRALDYKKSASALSTHVAIQWRLAILLFEVTCTDITMQACILAPVLQVWNERCRIAYGIIYTV